VQKKAQFTHERVEYNVFLFDEPLKGSNLSKSFHIGENSQILTVSNKKKVLNLAVACVFCYTFAKRRHSLSFPSQHLSFVSLESLAAICHICQLSNTISICQYCRGEPSSNIVQNTKFQPRIPAIRG
jgi:hypothetical protein